MYQQHDADGFILGMTQQLESMNGLFTVPGILLQSVVVEVWGVIAVIQVVFKPVIHLTGLIIDFTFPRQSMAMKHT